MLERWSAGVLKKMYEFYIHLEPNISAAGGSSTNTPLLQYSNEEKDWPSLGSLTLPRGRGIQYRIKRAASWL